MELRDKRIVVMGLGRFGGGVGVTRFLAGKGAHVLVTDLLPAEQLRDSLAKLADLPNVEYALAGHRESDFARADLIVVNPAVDARQNIYLQAAMQAGVSLTSEIRLLTQHLPDRQRTIGITGSAGKSTVTAMVGHALRKVHGDARVHVGGNLGGSLLGDLDAIKPTDWVVLELSSFMLEGLREDRWSPHIAVVTNFTANHLDRHGDLQTYQHAKQAILDFQDSEQDIAILGPDIHNRFDHQVRDMRFRELEDITNNPPIELLLPGEHNQVNATLAADILEAAGLSWTDAAAMLADFAGLPHRLQLVCEHTGVRFFNDSKCTTPEAASLAIRSFPAGVVHVILGGYDKGSDLTTLGKLAGEHCKAVYTIGATGPAVARAASGAAAKVIEAGDLDRAVALASASASAGDVVLLSPGCASYDQFDNYEQRGNRFAEAILRYNTECDGGRPAL